MPPLSPSQEADLHAALDHLGRGQYLEATLLCDRVLAAVPEAPEALHISALAMFRQGDQDAAIDRLVRAIEFQPENADFLANLALMQLERGELEAAIDCFAAAIELSPDDVIARMRHGQALQQAGRDDEAEAAYREIVRRAPDFAPARYNLAVLLEARGAAEQALAEFDSASRLSPDELSAASSAVHLRQALCDWRGIETLRVQLLERALRQPDLPRPPLPLDLLALPIPVSPAELHALMSSYARAHGIAAMAPPPSPAAVRSARRLWIGYVSADFGEHPVGHIVNALLGQHDRDAFDITAYVAGKSHPSTSVEHVVDLSTTNGEAAARRIRHDGIDLLVDLSGHTRGNRLDIFAHRPARAQATWLGFAGTLGTDFIDAVIADPVIAPAAEQPHYAEHLVHLPNSYFALPAAPGPAPSRAALGLPKQGMVFCAFAAPYKIEPVAFSIWMRLLAATPGAVLWLRVNNPAAFDNLRREAQARGVDPARLINAPRATRPDHLARLRAADIYLDTLFYGGHATAGEALAAGLPIVTCLGGGFAGRVGASLARSAGLPDLVAADLAAYETLARRLAQDAAALADAKQRLAAAHAGAPLFDTGRFMRDLEAAFRQIVAQAGN